MHTILLNDSDKNKAFLLMNQDLRLFINKFAAEAKILFLTHSQFEKSEKPFKNIYPLASASPLDEHHLFALSS